MEKVTSKEFFTVMWRGVCQVTSWFFGKFGFKKEGRLNKIMWRVFATSATIVLCFFAFAIVCGVGDCVYNKHRQKHQDCYSPGCWASMHISRDIYYHNTENGKSYVFNSRTGEKLIEHVTWIAEPNGEDTLVCFSNGKKRGYFSKNTGKVIIEPKYEHAWIFSEGLASVDDNGYIKFIDTTGKVIIDNKMFYSPYMDGLVFHGGYCIVYTDNAERCGLMDKTGKFTLPKEFDSIELENEYNLWHVVKGEEEAVLDKNLEVVIPFTRCSIYIDEGTIDLTMREDHTMRKYDMEGSLINDFYINSIRMLEYEKEEIVYRYLKREAVDVDDDVYDYTSEESYHPKATAKLRAYVAGDGFEGLMAADGHIVTMPLYKDIEALSYDLYLCTSTNNDKIIVNGKGEIVK